MTDRSDIDKGIKAEALLNDPVLIGAFDGVRDAILRQIEQAPMRDREGVHELKLMLKLLQDVKANLNKAAQDGKLSQAVVQRDAATRFRRMFNR